MKANWQTKNFEDCIEKVTYTQKIPRNKFLISGDFPVVSQEAEFINGYWDKKEDLFKIKKPVVIFGDHTQVLKYVDFDFVLGADGVKILQPKEFLDSKFFYYFLQSVDLKSLGYARHYRLLKEKQIPLPPLPEQHHIAKILDDVFENIKKAKENTEKNLQNSKDLFESYLQSVFANPGEDWEEKRLTEIADIEKIKNTKRNLPYVGMEDIESNSANFLGSLKPKNVKSTSFHFSPNHILYGRLRPYLNKILLPDFEGHCSTEVFPIMTGKEVDKKYLFYWFLQEKTAKAINETCTGARMPRANMKEVFDFYISFPKSLSEQKSIVARLDALSSETKKLEAIYKQKLADLEELKKSVLKKAFSGEL